jgi:hypothetical protein
LLIASFPAGDAAFRYSVGLTPHVIATPPAPVYKIEHRMDGRMSSNPHFQGTVETSAGGEAGLGGEDDDGADSDGEDDDRSGKTAEGSFCEHRT